MAYKIRVETAVILDIQEAIDWYNKRQKGLGRKFHNSLKKHFKTLSINPFYQVRYDDVRCLPVKKFPFMIHYTVSEELKIVTIRAVFNTSRDSNQWENI